jgi:hypothetical protein
MYCLIDTIIRNHFTCSTTLKNILSSGREKELLGKIIDGLVSRLMKRMCILLENVGTLDLGETCYSLNEHNIFCICFFLRVRKGAIDYKK